VAEWRTMSAFYEFLMNDLFTIKEIFDNEDDIAEEMCVLFSVDGFPIPEIFWRLYISKVDIEFSNLMNISSYFSGAGLLNITCDCSEENSYLCEISSISNNLLYERGKLDKDTMSDNYVKLVSKIQSLRSEMLS
jgi:hypothetical protein